MSLAQYAVYQVTGITVPVDGEMLPGPNSTDWDGQGTYVASQATVAGDEAVLQPGDVVFFGGGDMWHYAHSGIWVGGGQDAIWDALQTGTPVETHTLEALTAIYGQYDGAARYSSSVTPPVTTSVLVPSTGAALKGTGAVLDATAAATGTVSKVQFVLTGGSYNQSVIGTAGPTLYGYICMWNTTGVPNGSYTLQSLATDGVGDTAYSTGMPIIVDNTPPTTSVLVPSTGAALKGAALLDAGAADNVSVKTVQFVATGGTLNKTVIGTAGQTAYGYLFSWSTTSVANGSYTLQSLATDEAGNTAYSTGMPIIVDNTPPTTSVLVPSTGATVKGTSAVLDAGAADNVSVKTVQFVATGGTLNKTVIGTAGQTAYGYLFGWNTTTVPDGSYTLQSLATDEASNATYSAGITVTVNN